MRVLQAGGLQHTHTIPRVGVAGARQDDFYIARDSGQRTGNLLTL
ncbi:hypothetical protein KDA_05710 [Dictyobacter alpinus]|uniref:Uncharacterized protein n=1 Tax=Dictyobacter alpinus TaxID=2014873 RepID=A0A402B1A5_9CHLR|nr:hypothetical protein KDA_05710 [Dictyobacter alpinus]